MRLWLKRKPWDYEGDRSLWDYGYRELWDYAEIQNQEGESQEDKTRDIKKISTRLQRDLHLRLTMK